MVAISSLLPILRIFHPSLPKDPRTILKTPRSSNVRAIEGGSYYHFGIVKSYVEQIKGHSGYYGCDKCTQKGEWYSKVIFPSTNAPLRTNQAFSQMTDFEHHIGVTPLKTLSIGMVTQFPLDYMHLVRLGVTKRILMFLLKSPVRGGIRIGQTSINGISKRLFEFRTFIPREFSRKCRPLSDIERWKAVEFRQFLLYSGIVARKGHLSNALYKSFLLFFCWDSLFS